MPETLEEFLSEHRVGPSSQCTHTSLAQPRGKFYIPTHSLEDFYKLYEKAITSGNEICVTEVQRPIIPILIDLDFRALYQKNNSIPKKLYSQEQITQFIDSLRSILDELVEYTCADVYVMEKRQKPGKDNKDRLKDGVHIEIPDIVCDPIVQYLLRDNMLNRVREIFQTMHNKAEEIYDEKVIYDNPWIMYGGKKPKNDAYTLTNVIRIQSGSDEQMKMNANDYTTSFIIQTLSLQNKMEKSVKEKVDVSDTSNQPENTQVLDLSALEQHIKKKNDKDTKRNIITIKPTETNSMLTKSQSSEKDVKLAHELVGVLDPQRAENYEQWIRVGWALHNISNELLSTWIEFSSRSNKYKDDSECRRLWQTMRDQGLGMGSLRQWAKTDNFQAYNEVIRTIADDQVEKSLSDSSHFQIAYVIYQKYKDQYVCTSIKSNQWYYFNGFRWKKEYGSKLNWNISNDIYAIYMEKDKEYADILAREGTQGNDDDDTPNERIQRLQKRKKQIMNIAMKLRDTSFKDKLFKELKYMMFDETFLERLDEHRHLLAFDNCVVDLNTLEVRHPYPEDMISMTCGYDFIWMDEHQHPVKGDVRRFIESVFVDEDIRRYAMKVFAQALHGEIQEQKFWIAYGGGKNGKSSLFSIIHNALGDYMHIMGVQYFTEKRSGANQAQSDIAQARCKRIITTEEPDEQTALNPSVIKSICSGGFIRARELYSQSTSFQLMASVFMACNNLPIVNSNDYGSWRRIECIPFRSHFSSEPNPDDKYSFSVDRDLDTKIETDEWKCAFMNILLEWYAVYKEERLYDVPEAVHAMTNKYKRDNDIVCQFIDNYLEEAPENEDGSVPYIPGKQIAQEYTQFCRRQGKPKPKSNKEVGEVLSHQIPVVFRNATRWYVSGYRFLDDDDE